MIHQPSSSSNLLLLPLNQTISSTTDKTFKSSDRTDSYGKNSITVGAINSWNKVNISTIICHLNISVKSLKVKRLFPKKCIGDY